jgi:S-methylmethionine-dependent homocysteine/selenocysteine methylase
MSQLITQRLAQARPVLLDGAMGTELDRRGVATTLPLWSAGALESAPAVVQAIHSDYIQAGAEVITTNTFRTHARNVGNPSKARRLTHRAVELAALARQEAHAPQQVWIAGSIAPLEDCYSPHLTPSAEECRREHDQMAQYLAEAEVDLLLIETMNTLHEALAAAQAAHATGLPFGVSFVLDEHYDLLSGEALALAIETIQPLGPSAFLVNCIPTAHIQAALARLRGLTDLPIGAYGNMGTPDAVVGWAAAADMPPAQYCHHAQAWVAAGAQIIGSCCGSQPAHTQALQHWREGATIKAL